MASAPSSEYPIGVPFRFSPEGDVQRFPGNTTLCHLPHNSPLLPGLHDLYKSVASNPTLQSCIHLLPPDSWHMTVLDGVLERNRDDPRLWPAGNVYLPLDECTRLFAERLQALGHSLESEGLAPPYRMKVRSFDPLVNGIGLEVIGATVEEEQRMRRLRDRIADTMGFRAPNHDTYCFHISVAYLLRHLSQQERRELERVTAQHLPALELHFDLDAVKYCAFEDMHLFSRVFYLGGSSGKSTDPV